MNQFQLVGNLTRDPESSVMTNGKQQARFSIAVNRPYRDAEGNQGVDYIQIKCYEKNAENVVKYLSKGRKVGVVGHIKTGKYDKDGRTIYTTDFIADNVEFLSSPQNNTQQAEPAPEPKDAETGYTQVSGDELPF